MKIVYNNIIPFKGFSCINLFGVLFARKKYKPINEVIIRHESIHTKQMIGLLFIFFYIIYLIEWIIRCFLYGDTKEAYKNISFEREAYANEKNLHYKMKLYNWIKYIRK